MTYQEWKEKVNSFGVYFFVLYILVAIFSMGITANLHAVIGNEGRMPVETDYPLDTDKHFSFQEKNEVNNYYLTDIIHLETEKRIFDISIGDIIIFVSVFLMVGVTTHLVYFDIRRKEE